jgi:predicted nucleic acid-binding protein
MKIYLDTSALNRIFDDQSQPRIYLESSSMLVVFVLIENQVVDIVSSDVLLFENLQNPHNERRTFVGLVLERAKSFHAINDKILKRAQEIEVCGIIGLDSLHLACAELLEADCFVTCDDKILKKYRGNLDVKNPTEFVMDIIKGEENDTE